MDPSYFPSDSWKTLLLLSELNLLGQVAGRVLASKEAAQKQKQAEQGMEALPINELQMHIAMGEAQLELMRKQLAKKTEEIAQELSPLNQETQDTSLTG